MQWSKNEPLFKDCIFIKLICCLETKLKPHHIYLITMSPHVYSFLNGKGMPIRYMNI